MPAQHGSAWSPQRSKDRFSPKRAWENWFPLKWNLLTPNRTKCTPSLPEGSVFEHQLQIVTCVPRREKYDAFQIFEYIIVLSLLATSI